MAFPYHLVVIHDFDTYKRGQKITNDNECEQIMSGDNAHHVHRIEREETAPAAVAAPAPSPAAAKS